MKIYSAILLSYRLLSFFRKMRSIKRGFIFFFAQILEQIKTPPPFNHCFSNNPAIATLLSNSISFEKEKMRYTISNGYNGCLRILEAVSQFKIPTKRTPNRGLYRKISIQFRKIPNYGTTSSIGGIYRLAYIVLLLLLIVQLHQC